MDRSAKLRYSILQIESQLRDESEVDGQSNQQYTEPAEANFLFLRGSLENVHSEKERVRRELERAQHE